MYTLVFSFNPTKFLVEADKARKIAKWGLKCKNKKTRERILKSCIKIIKNSKVNRNAIQLVRKS